jgi:hypothetical protein
MKRLIFVAIVAFSIVACSGGSTNKNGTDNANRVISKVKQLNISILLDLSDRISPKINPVAQINDIEDIKTITEFFKSNMTSLGAYKAKGKIRIFFSPTPTQADINSIVSKLIIDCSKMDNKGRKEVYDNMTGLYTKNLNQIYQETIATSDWKGSDIWRFFKDDVKDFCIEKDTNYRNILIIFTDGYLYHPQTMFKDKNNRYTYLLGSKNLNNYRNQNWEQMIQDDDFGIITERKDLNDMEVLVLEVKAENPSYKIDEDILQFLWKKWFKEMNISHYEVYHSDLPANTKTRIENFLNQK